MLGLTKDNFDYDYFLDLSPDLVCIGGYDGMLKKVNTAVLTTLGYTTEELFSKPIASFVHPEDRASADRLSSALAAREVVSFENRNLTKAGSSIWLAWTLVPVERDQLFFATARRLSEDKHLRPPGLNSDSPWLRKFESVVRRNLGHHDLNITMLSNELALSERQLFREVKSLMNTTPNHLLRLIRLQLAREAMDGGRYRSVSEIARFAGFKTSAYFSKLFKEVYGVPVMEVLAAAK